MGGIKRTPADKWFSDCVRERANWTCERCGTKYEGDTRGLDCSHFYGRAGKSTRYDPLNAFAHCRGCHQYLSSNPDSFVGHYREVFGESGLDKVRIHKGDVDRGRRAVREIGEVAKHYRSEHRRMAEMRLNGTTGRIEFRDYFEEGEDE